MSEASPAALAPAAIERLLLDLAGERSLDRLLALVAERLAGLPEVALARVWLVAPGDICERCPARAECPGHIPCLQLVASAGRPREPGADWSRLDGDFSRFPIGGRKVGRVAESGEPLIANDLGEDPESLQRPEWARAEGLVAFGGQPLRFRGETLGVLGLFLRTRLARDDLDRLRTIADHAAATIAAARAFEEVEHLRARLEARTEWLEEEVREVSAFGAIVGQSRALERLTEQVTLVAPSDATVLITGESGTGKELVARAIHEGSPRAGAPMVRVNCAAIARDLFESEFFGHARGAFTGASRDRLGRLGAAEGGTLFLDEVGEIPLGLQAKLLRAIEEGEYERVGESATRRADVRVIAATNRKLEAAVREGAFRDDLYYRLNVFPIEVPPLRERPEDVPVLARHFLANTRRAGELELSPENLASLQAYPWPGNVRELRSVIERAAIVTPSGPLRLDLRAAPEAARAGGVLSEPQMRAFERENLLAALEACGGKIYGPGGAARLLELRPTTLVSRLKRYGIRP